MKSIYLLLLLSFSCLFCTDRAERFPTGPVDLSLILNSEERNRFGIGPNSPRREELSLAYPLEQRPAATGDQSWFDWMSGSVVALWGKQENPVEGQEEQDDTDSNDADDFEVVAYTQKQQEILNRPLFVACMRGTKEDILSALACGAQINARDISGNRPLHEAVRYNRYDIIELLLSSGASLSVANNLKITPLMVAIDNGDVKTVSLLLKNGALLSDKDFTGKTALECAIERGSFTVVKTVLLYCDRTLFFSCGNLSEQVAQRVSAASKHAKHEDEFKIAQKVLNMLYEFIEKPDLLGSALVHVQDPSNEPFVVVDFVGHQEERSTE